MKRLMISALVMVMVLSGCGTDTNYDETVAVDKTTETTTTEAAATTEGETTIETPAEPVELRVIMPYGTPALSMVKMVVEQPSISENVTVAYELVQATDVLTSTLINKEADIAIVPTNLAAVMHTKGAGYKLAGSAVWGVMYIASTEEVSSIEDLKGKEISAFGRNLTPDAVLRYVLTEKGINPDEDITLNYFSGTSEVAADFIGGQHDYALLAEPVLTSVSMKREGTAAVIDLQKEWSDLTGLENYPQASIVIREELIANHPEIVDAFLEAYSTSVAWLNDNPADAGAYYESLSIGLSAPIIQKAIPFCNLYYKSAEEGKAELDSYLEVLNTFNPALTGGQPVDDSFYYLP